MEQVQELIDTILWDRRIVDVIDDIDAPVRTVVIRDPTVLDRKLAEHVRAKSLRLAISQGVPTEEDVMRDARESEYWTEEDDSILENAEEHIKMVETRLEKQKLGVGTRRKLERNLEESKTKLADTEAKQSNIMSNTAEYLANEAALFQMMRSLVYTMSDEPLWPDEKSFFHTKRHFTPFVNFLAQVVFSEGMLTATQVRLVARSGEWRILWTCGRENLVSLFNRPVSDLNVNQRSLVYWSKIYDIGYESTDRPSQDVIDDDDRYDDWLENHLKDQDKDSRSISKRRGKHRLPSDHNEFGMVLEGEYCDDCTCGVSNIEAKGLGERPMHKADCLYGVFMPYTEEEKEEKAARIYGRNATNVRHYLNSEHDAVAKHGQIDEKDLRKRRARELLGAQSQVHKRK